MEKKKTERAIIINSIETLKSSKLFDLKRYDVIYYGSFFCQNIIPKISDIEYLKKNGFNKIVLLTSFMSYPAIEKAKKQISEILYSFIDIDVLINDLGILEYLNRNYKNVKKGIGIPLSIEFIRMRPDELEDLMKKYNIYSIETDEYYMIKNFKKRNFSIHYHYPYRYIAMSRFCPENKKISEKCKFECFLKSKIILTPQTKKSLLCYENAYFIKNKRPELKVERIVENITYSSNLKNEQKLI